MTFTVTVVSLLPAAYDAVAQESPYMGETSGTGTRALFHSCCGFARMETTGGGAVSQFLPPGAEAHGQESGMSREIPTADYMEPETTYFGKMHKNPAIMEASLSCGP